MALLEGDERSGMPSMSWNSVVKERSAAKDVSPRGKNGDESERDVAPAAAPPPEPVSFSTPSLTTTAPVSPPRVSTAPTSVAPAPVAPVTTEPIAPIAPISPIAPIAPIAPVVTPPPAVAPVAPEPASPAAAPVAPPVVDDPQVVDVPQIVEATPSAAVVAEVADIVAQPVQPTPNPEPTPAATDTTVVAAPEPVAAVPEPVTATATVPNQALSLPIAAAVPPASHHGVETSPPKVRKARKDRSGSIARVGFFFLIVAAVASAAVIFGRPYLFPADWEANALEFAEPIEEARGSDFVEPVLLIPQPNALHRDMVAAQLLGDPASSLPMWRALGLAGSDSTDDATLAALISEQSPVLYSIADGQVYYDASFTRSDRAALISRAMATAALDQDFSFSTDALNRSLDDEAITEANVRHQAAVIAQSASERGALQSPDMAALSFLPSVLDYRLTAPTVFADLLPPVNDVELNPLASLGLEGAGPLRVAPLAQIPSNSVTIGDTAVASTVVTDRSFWYMSFASHLDATTAYRMSNDIQSAGLQMVDSQTGRCAVATFATVDATTNVTLQADLEVWVAATAPELGATVSTMPDGKVQLRSCDPAGVYASNIRFGVARQLIAWRSVELAVTNLVVAQGGSAGDVVTAVDQVGSTPAAIAVAQLPAGTTPADLAIAAQAAARDVIATVGLPIDPVAPADQGAVESAASGEG